MLSLPDLFSLDPRTLKRYPPPSNKSWSLMAKCKLWLVVSMVWRVKMLRSYSNQFLYEVKLFPHSIQSCVCSKVFEVHAWSFLPLTSPRSASKLEEDRKSLLQLHDDIAALKAKFDADKCLSSETLTASHDFTCWSSNLCWKFQRHDLIYKWKTKGSNDFAYQISTCGNDVGASWFFRALSCHHVTLHPTSLICWTSTLFRSSHAPDQNLEASAQVQQDWHAWAKAEKDGKMGSMGGHSTISKKSMEVYEIKLIYLRYFEKYICDMDLHGFNCSEDIFKYTNR